MLVASLIFCHLCVFVAANPFHKYPFIFLLDVGNEELEKTNSEQIRVSIPGGSLALRYPAIGNGNTISHVRVSGIDFGTDLKANIVDGGPGYKYVVLVLVGNPDVAYDAVLTVKTVSDNDLYAQKGEFVGNSENNDSYQTEEDANNSVEDLNDEDNLNSIQKNSNSESMQSSANVYSYVENEPNHESDNDRGEDNSFGDGSEITNNVIESDETNEEYSKQDDQYDETSNEKGVKRPYSESVAQENDSDALAQDFSTDNDEKIDDDDDEENNSLSLEQPFDDSEEKPVVIDNNLYSNYKVIKDHLNFERKAISQEELEKSQKPVYQEELSDYKGSEDAGLMYEDEEWSNNNDENYRDPDNNNYIDLDDGYAVAY